MRPFLVGSRGLLVAALVDSMGLLVVVVVTAASVTDAAGAMTVLRHVWWCPIDVVLRER